MLRILRLLLPLLLAATTFPLSAVSAGAAVDANAEAQFVQLINSARASAGLPALSSSGELRSVARSHSARMAAANDLHHNPNLSGQVSNWLSIGENVGRGPTVDSIHTAFMNSAGHRKNILYQKFTEVGVGVEVVDGRIWVTEVFRKPEGASAPAPKPEPAPEPKPQEASQPAPQPARVEDAAPAPAGQSAGGDAPSQTSTPEPESAAPSAPPAPVRTPAKLDHAGMVIAHLQSVTTGRSVAATWKELGLGR